MQRVLTLALPILLLSLSLSLSPLAAEEDRFLWLEEVLGEKPLQWVEEQNRRSTEALQAVPEYSVVYERTLTILDSNDRIPTPSFTGDWVFNFWQDEAHPRGVLRRTTVDRFQSEAPAWEIVLDIDELSKREEIPWVYKGRHCLAPEYRLCLFVLSRGGSDASEVREFDLAEKQFVPNGFRLEEAKSTVTWKDENTLWVGTDFGEGSLTDSGYPRTLKAWKRGTPLMEATPILQIPSHHIGVWLSSEETAEGTYRLALRYRESFFESDLYLAVGDRLVRLDLPLDASPHTVFRDHLLVSLRSEWSVSETTYPSGSLLAIGLDGLLQGEPHPEILFEPSERISLDSVDTTRDQVLLTTLDNVSSRLYRVEYSEGEWPQMAIELPGLGTASLVDASRSSDRFFFSYEDFLTPDTLFLAGSGRSPKVVKESPSFFDVSGLEVTQLEAASADGTRIPYFLVRKEGGVADGSTPTLLYAYGGFQVSRTARYSAILGSAWLESGGAYALANIRGGGEFGPEWHQAAVRENRMRNFEDFIGVAEDLIRRKITAPAHLGIMGGSQGGLLVGGTFVLRPDLFNAVVSQVPLLDMKRYHRLLAGASWMSEYGDPDDPTDWEFMQEWSPYQRLREEATYPEPFFWTTTRDDRVHPGHARKMVAKMEDLGHPVLYFENVEGGHGAGSVNTQRAEIQALQYAYLWKKLR